MKRSFIVILILLFPYKIKSAGECSKFYSRTPIVINIKDVNRSLIIKSIISVELNGNSNDLINEKENAVGVLQIRLIMIKEVNLILRKHKYKLIDRFDSTKSVEIFEIYQDTFNPKWNVERAARLWNGGRNGMIKHSTYKYYKRVLKVYLKLHKKVKI